MTERHILIEQLAATLEVTTKEALEECMTDVESVSYSATHYDDPARPHESDEDAIVGEVVALYTEALPDIRERLLGWFGIIAYEKAELIDQESGDFVAVVSEHWKPQGWQDQRDMPTTFTIRFTSSFDKWLQGQGWMLDQ